MVTQRRWTRFLPSRALLPVLLLGICFPKCAGYQPISEGLRQDVLLYFADLDMLYATKKNPKEWKKVVSDLNTLRSTHATCSPAPTARNWSVPEDSSGTNFTGSRRIPATVSFVVPANRELRYRTLNH